MSKIQLQGTTSLPSEISQLASLFEVYDQKRGEKLPVVLSKSQEEIFRAIVTRDHPRYHVMTTTQYGKSFVVALATLLRAATKPEKWAIIAPTEKQAKIIMGYIIDHAFDHPLIKDQLIQTEKEDRLKAEKSKKRITFRRGGEIFILSADTKNKKAAGEALMGFGCIPEGYKITTDKGLMNIEDVVNNKVDVKILSYNHKNSKLEFQKIKQYQKNPIHDRYILEFNLDGKKFQCTDDHPVYVVGKGYIPARDVKTKDELYVI